MNTPTLHRLEDEATACIGYMQPKLQNIINRGYLGDAILCGMTTVFVELTHVRGGKPLILHAMEASASLPAAAQEQFSCCYERVKALTDEAKAYGFTPHQISLAMLDAIISFSKLSGLPCDQVQTARKNMITRIKVARQRRRTD